MAAARDGVLNPLHHTSFTRSSWEIKHFSLSFGRIEGSKKEIAMNKNLLHYLLDAVIGLAFLVAGVTGIAFLFLGSGGYQGGRNPGFTTVLLGLERGTWSDLHDLAGLVMIAGIAVHLILHWRWIVATTRQFLSRLFRRPARAYAAAE
jgi:hypothetical protein